MTIDLQSVLGMSAIQAGLTITPVALTMAVVAPFARRLTDRIGGRYILLLGFLMAAAGTAGVAAVESRDATSLTFALPLAGVGFGMGCVIAPLTTEALREVPTVLAGAASGMLNTSRQLGAATGLAVIGAVLQNQLASAMRVQAVADATQLPAPFRQGFIDGFAKAGSSGLQVGRGQSGGAVASAGLPPQAAELVQKLAHGMFVNAYTNAVRPTVGLAVAALMLGALSCRVDRSACQGRLKEALPDEPHVVATAERPA